MGRGNVCVTGEYEGLFYIDNDDWNVYRKDRDYEEPLDELGRYLTVEDFQTGEWRFDDEGSQEELEDILEYFIVSFTSRFSSFKEVKEDKWLDKDRDRQILLESGLFYVCIEDNQWSMAVELIQKEDWYDNHLNGLQKRHYQKYLDGIRDSLLERLDSIGVYGGGWTSGTVTREDLKDG